MDMPDPDWTQVTEAPASRAGDPSGKSHTVLGDPLKWGSTVVRVISDPAVGLFTFDDSPQFLRIQTADVYARQWSLLGTLSVPPAMWALPAANWLAFLEIIQGAGQTTITQLFDLRLLTSLGLTAYGVDTFELGFERRSFAITGGILGQAWGVRMRQALAAGSGIANARQTLSCISAPLAAGTGL